LAIRLPICLAPGPAGLEIPGQHLEQSQIPLGTDIAGINYLHPVIGRAGLFEPVKIAESNRLVVQRVDKIRPKRDRPIEPGQRFLLAAKQLQGDGYTVAAVGIAGIEHVRPLIDGDDILKLSEAQHIFGTGHHRRNVIRARFEAWLKDVERFLQPTGLVEQGAAFLRRVPMRGR